MRNLLVLGVIAAATAAPALAQEVTVTGNVSLTTDYAFRGISQTQEEPALQGGFDATFGDSGFYAGAWASSINFGTGGSNMGSTSMAATSSPLGPVAMDVGGVLGYLYPGAADDFIGELDYYEVYAKPSIALTDQVHARRQLSPTRRTSPNEIGRRLLLRSERHLRRSPELSFSGAVGIQTRRHRRLLRR